MRPFLISLFFLVCSSVVVGARENPYDGMVLSGDIDCPIRSTEFRKVILIDLNRFRLCLYDDFGRMIFSSIATGGAMWCNDVGRSCKTPPGEYEIGEKHDSEYFSKSYPVSCVDAPRCGAIMPYYLEFKGKNFGIHAGFVPRNPLQHISHGCVRIPFPNAKRLHKMVSVGMKVRILPYVPISH